MNDSYHSYGFFWTKQNIFLLLLKNQLMILRCSGVKRSHSTYRAPGRLPTGARFQIDLVRTDGTTIAQSFQQIFITKECEGTARWAMSHVTFFADGIDLWLCSTFACNREFGRFFPATLIFRFIFCHFPTLKLNLMDAFPSSRCYKVLRRNIYDCYHSEGIW